MNIEKNEFTSTGDFLELTKTGNFLSNKASVDYKNYSQEETKKLQGKILTLLEASLKEGKQLDSIKQIVNGYFAELLSEPSIIYSNGTIKVTTGNTLPTFPTQEYEACACPDGIPGCLVAHFKKK